MNTLLKNKNTILAIIMVTIIIGLGLVLNIKISEIDSIKQDYKAKETKIQVIKNQIEEQKVINTTNKKELDIVQRKYVTTVWYIRCLEAIGELELKGKEYNTECKKYDEKDEKSYIELKKFASYNLNATRKELGL